MALLGMDHRVLRTEKPQAALEALATEPVAVVVSDQRMPGMLGTELLARSRDIAPDAVRILLTAFTDIPEPNDSRYAEAVADAVRELARSSEVGPLSPLLPSSNAIRATTRSITSIR